MGAIEFVRRLEASGTLELGDRQYTVQWHVRTTDPLYQAVTVLTAEDPTTGERIPGYLESFALGYDSDSYSTCRRIRCAYMDRPKSRIDWIVTAEFSSRAGDPPDAPEEPTQPWTRRAKWAIRQADYTEIQTHGSWFGSGLPIPILNTAGQKYDPPVEAQRGRTLLDVIWYTESVRLFLLDKYRFTVNSGPWRGFAEQTVRINLLEADEIYENGIWYVQRHCQLEVKDPDEVPPTWQAYVLEEGMLCWDETNSQYVLPEDGDGNLHTVPVLLDSTGGQLDKDADPVFTDWNVYKTLPFDSSELGLPAFPPYIEY